MMFLVLVLALLGASTAKPPPKLFEQSRMKRQSGTIYCDRTFNSSTSVNSFSSSSCGVAGDGNYPNNAQFTFRISTRNATCASVSVDMNINVANIEQATNCVYDYLQISGSTERICGVNRYVSRSVTAAAGSDVVLRFSSDGSVTGQGFTVSYSLSCSGGSSYNTTSYPPYTTPYYYTTTYPFYYNYTTGYPYSTTGYPYYNYSSPYYYTTTYPYYYNYTTGYPGYNYTTYPYYNSTDVYSVLSSLDSQVTSLYNQLSSISQLVQNLWNIYYQNSNFGK